VADALDFVEIDNFGLATVLARKGNGAAEIGNALGAEVAVGPRFIPGSTTLLGCGPGHWLAFTERSEPGWHQAVAGMLKGLASVSDQSSGYVVHRLSGPAARQVLQRGAPVDLDPSVFGPGMVATTVIAHITVTIWQVDDAPTYFIAFFRSYARSLRHWVELTAAAL